MHNLAISFAIYTICEIGRWDNQIVNTFFEIKHKFYLQYSQCYEIQKKTEMQFSSKFFIKKKLILFLKIAYKTISFFFSFWPSEISLSTILLDAFPIQSIAARYLKFLIISQKTFKGCSFYKRGSELSKKKILFKFMGKRVNRYKLNCVILYRMLMWCKLKNSMDLFLEVFLWAFKPVISVYLLF